jgi:hypothetical protein
METEDQLDDNLRLFLRPPLVAGGLRGGCEALAARARTASQSRAMAAKGIDDVRATDMFRLDGRVAFISGAAGHLGRAMTLALAGAGAHVIVNGRNDARLKDFEGELASLRILGRARRVRCGRARARARLLFRRAPASTFSSTTPSR